MIITENKDELREMLRNACEMQIHFLQSFQEFRKLMQEFDDKTFGRTEAFEMLWNKIEKAEPEVWNTGRVMEAWCDYLKNTITALEMMEQNSDVNKHFT